MDNPTDDTTDTRQAGDYVPSISLADLPFTAEENERISTLLCRMGIPPEQHLAYREDLVGFLYSLLDNYFNNLNASEKAE